MPRIGPFGNLVFAGFIVVMLALLLLVLWFGGWLRW
jgi:hypothetical protein